jgi:hypothetical protein
MHNKGFGEKMDGVRGYVGGSEFKNFDLGKHVLD